jgi:drug/metabolite transporter (DMT)-like permease
MLYLLLSVLCSVTIANLLMRFNRKGRRSILPVFLGNYMVAGIFSFAAMPPRQLNLPLFDLVLGILTGVFFLLNFWVYQRSIVINGLSLSVGVMRISMIVPVIMAVLLFKDRLSVFSIAGIITGLAAFGLRANLSELHNLLWLAGLCLVSGLTDASLKVFKALGSGMEAGFIFVIFGSAFVFTLGAILIGKLPIPLGSLIFGCLLGIPNRYSTVFFLKGLDSVPASIAYPLVAVAIMLLSILSDLLIWKKQAKARDAILWALLIISLILLNL